MYTAERCLVRSVFVLRMAVDPLLPCAFQQFTSAMAICVVKMHWQLVVNVYILWCS